MENSSDELIIESNHKFLKIIIVVLVLVLIIGGLFGGYYYMVYSNPMYAFSDFIKKVENEVDNDLEIDLAKPLRLSGNFNINIDSDDPKMLEAYNIFNDLDFLYDVKVDYQKKIVSADLSGKYKEDSLLDIGIYTEDGIGYFDFVDLYDKPISYEIDDYNELFSEDITSDNKNKVDELKKYFEDNFKRSDFVREKSNFTYDGKEYQGYKNTLNIEGEKYQGLMKIINEDNPLEYLGSVKLSVYSEGYDNHFVKLGLEIISDNEKVIIDFATKDEINIKFDFDENECEFVINIISDYSYKIRYKFTEDDIDYVIMFAISIENTDELASTNVTNSVKYDDLTEEEINDIMLKLLENEAMINLIDAASKISSSDLIGA